MVIMMQYLAFALYLSLTDTQTQTESSTQRRTTTGGGTSGVYILRNIMKEHFILPEIVKISTEDYVHTGVLYVILALLFIHEREMDSSR